MNDFNCTCLVGYNGTTCEHNIDDCVNHNCTQNQVCIDGVNGFTCNCKPGKQHALTSPPQVVASIVFQPIVKYCTTLYYMYKWY